MIFVYTVCNDKKEAGKIGLYLVKRRLAACVNIFPLINSIYRWKGKIERTKESVLIIKTAGKNFKKIEAEVKKMHSYSVPCILEINIKQGDQEYLKWLKSELK